MTFHRPALLGLLAALACAPVLAQTTAVAATKSAPHKGEAQALQWFSMLDANNDGRISLQEASIAFRLKPSLQAQFRATDTNHDGYLTADEIRAAADRKRAERRARQPAAPAATQVRAQTAR